MCLGSEDCAVTQACFSRHQQLTRGREPDSRDLNFGGKVRDKNLRPEPHSPMPGTHQAASPTGYSDLKTSTAASLRSGLSPSLWILKRRPLG